MNRAPAQSGRRQAGISLLETVIALVLTSILVVGGLSLSANKSRMDFVASQQMQASSLVQDLMAEILALDYEEPVDEPTFGRESGESTADRRQWDDVDDFEGLDNTPPKARDGSDLTEYANWTRTASITWATPDDVDTPSPTATDIKRIEVSVSLNGRLLGRSVAVRSNAWPLIDPNARTIRVMYVVSDELMPTSSETAIHDWMIDQGYDVTLIGTYQPVSDFDAAVSSSDVAYVSNQASELGVGTKLTDASIGVVCALTNLVTQLELANEPSTYTGSNINVVDTSHYVTSTMSPGDMTVCLSMQDLAAFGGPGPGVNMPAKTYEGGSADKAILVADTGAILTNGNPSAGRRVQLPWGGTAFDTTSLSSDARTIMQRAIEWAAERESGS